MKRIAGFFCVVAMLSTATPAFAVEKTEISSLNYIIEATQGAAAPYSLEINDKLIDLGTTQAVKMQGTIMVPLRMTAEALGFTVTWDEERRVIHMNNGTMQTDLALGENNYFAYSSKAIGMTAPQSLGAAPTVMNGFTYVPVDLYNILLTDPNSVQVKDNKISISVHSNKQDGAEPTTQIPNPLVEYNSLDEAQKAVGYTFATPKAVPDGYQIKNIIVISNDLAEIFYTKGDSTILYRTAKSNTDISGDYTVYDAVSTITIGNAEVTVKGSNACINLAVWSKDGVSYSLSFTQAVSEKELSTIIQSIQ